MVKIKELTNRLVTIEEIVAITNEIPNAKMAALKVALLQKKITDDYYQQELDKLLKIIQQ